jgi:hypothetical protein
MDWLWFLAVVLTASGAGLAAWAAVDLRRRAVELAADAERVRDLGREAAALGADARRLRARLAVVEARAASGPRPGAG